MGSARPALTSEQVEELREELIRALAKLERSMKISDEAARPVELDQAAVGRLSRIDSIQNQSLTQGLQERERARLGAIVQALERIEKGSYGICVDCEDPIRYERLLIFPETATCTACGAAAG